MWSFLHKTCYIMLLPNVHSKMQKTPQPHKHNDHREVEVITAVIQTKWLNMARKSQPHYDRTKMCAPVARLCALT